ncbi:60S ribosomal export protein NMD3 [Candidatus Nanohalococcus occultus]|uniref:NMD protein affecting ribosome stability and mRNA decay n=1 Tax=Candidatus Nanohalococcus occultus TaxID=2978047 RepID=A0ABY8CFH1_9ARCH|nr:NMD protein affecting ribosome stability and mRNA decay [Candidatus Nanohaloarchaeota archaeon SVXNc]
MNLTKFCPRCGKETEKLYGERKKLCADCYPDKNDLLEIPDVVEITICSVCGRMEQSGKWLEEYSVIDQLSAKFSEYNEEGIEMQLQYWEEDEDFLVRVHATKGEIKASYDTEVRFSKTQCKNCSKFASGFFKVKIQLRGDGDLEKVSNEIMDHAAEITNDDRNKFLSNVEKNHSGYDIFLSTEPMAKQILSRLRKHYDPDIKRSYELMGEENGEEVYRNVVSVRIE